MSTGTSGVGDLGVTGMEGMEPTIAYYRDGTRPTNSGLSILSINVHSLRNKRDLLEAEILRLGPVGVIVVSETWIEPGSEVCYNLNGFRAYHETRADGYGGLSVFVRETIEHSLVHNVTRLGIHVMTVKLGRTRIVAAYRQPVNNMSTFTDMLDEALEGDSDCLLVGDMNVDILRPGPNLSSFRDVLHLNSMVILNKADASFATFPLSGSLIDLYCSNFLDRAFELCILDSAISDHVMQLLTITGRVSGSTEERYPRTEWKEVRRRTEQYLRDSCTRSMVSLHEFLVDTVASNTREVPRTKTNENLGWFDVRINNEMLLRDFLNRRRHDLTLDPRSRHFAYLMYRRQRNRVTAMIREARRRDVADMVESAIDNQALMWKVLSFILTNRKKRARQNLPHELVLADGSRTTDAAAISDEFVSFFSSIAASLRSELLSLNGNRPRQHTLPDFFEDEIEMRPVTSLEVATAIGGLRDGAASGYDRISVGFLKSMKQLLVPYLVEATNSVLQTQEFPAPFKTAKLVCLFKSGDPRSCRNYRPISILPTLSKILEKILYDRLMGFLHEADFFHPRQFGFLPRSNTSGACLSAVNVIHKGIESNRFVLAVFIDVSKAFDCVSHEILLNKMSSTGIRGTFHNLLSSYLFGRRHRLYYDDESNCEGPVTHGVPQGSRLSTLLFLVYMNDIFGLPLKSYMQLFADDILLVFSAEDKQTLLDDASSDLNLIYDWFYSNLLSFNVKKSTYMLIAAKGKDTVLNQDLFVRGQKMERVESYKYLGLVIDSKLAWDKHVDLIKSKIRPFLALLRRTAYLLPSQLKLSVYYAYIHSHLVHLSAIWGATGSTRIMQLQRLQNKAIRLIFYQEYRGSDASTEDLRKKYGILQVADLIRYEFCMSIYKVQNRLLKTSFSLATTSDNHGYHTRRRSHVQLPRSRTNHSRSSVWHEGVNMFNSLPSPLRHATSILVFKRLLKLHLLSPST